LLVGIAHLSDPRVRVQNADGVTPQGLPYLDFSKAMAGRRLAPGEATDSRSLAFYDPDRNPFTYDLVVFGALNRPPAFPTVPVADALTSRSYVYDADASDPDGDALSFALEAGPPGITIDRATGLISWNPSAADVGTHSIAVRVADGQGGSDEQRYVLSV